MSVESISPKSGSKKSGVIALVGRPNTGKSTLMNTLLGADISIVSSKAQTTRERIHGILDSAEGQILFVDTPGVHRAKAGGLNQYMVKEAEKALQGPNLIWYLIEPASRLEHEREIIDLIRYSRSPVMILCNKVDREGEYRDLENIVKTMDEFGINRLGAPRMISAKTRLGLDSLLHETWAVMPQGEPLYPDSEQISDRPMRFFAAEKIRSQLYALLGDELPYSCAVVVTTYSEQKPLTRIEATIWVERDSQKAIVIGNGGKKIKEIGIEARKEIEALIQSKIFLGLKVDVAKNWTRDPERMRKLGYVGQ